MTITIRPSNVPHDHDVFVNGVPKGSVYRHRGIWRVDIWGKNPPVHRAMHIHPGFFSFKEASDDARSKAAT